MLMIRLQRVGRRNHAEYRVVVTESTRAPKAGNYVEIVGSYNPHKNELVCKDDRIKHWMSVGAQVSDTVHNLLVNKGLIEGKKKNVLPKKSPPVKEVTEEEKPAAETPAEDAAEESKEETEAPAEEKEEEKAAA